jgi:hypothetical protein
MSGSASEELDHLYDLQESNYGRGPNYSHGPSAVPEGPLSLKIPMDAVSRRVLKAPKTQTTLHLLRALVIVVLLLEILRMSLLFGRMIPSELIERKCKSGQLNQRQVATHHGQINGPRRRKLQNRRTSLNRTMSEVSPALSQEMARGRRQS